MEMGLDDLENEDEMFIHDEDKRPLLITIACSFGFLYVFLVFYVLLISGTVRTTIIQIYGVEFFIFLIIDHLVILTALIGIWKMKYWGAITYASLFILSSTYVYAVKVHTAWWEYIPSLILISLCFHYKDQLK